MKKALPSKDKDKTKTYKPHRRLWRWETEAAYSFDFLALLMEQMGKTETFRLRKNVTMKKVEMQSKAIVLEVVTENRKKCGK